MFGFVTFPETVGVEVFLKNPLKIPLNLTNLLLLWKFTSKDQATSVSNEVGTSEIIPYSKIVKYYLINCKKKKKVSRGNFRCKSLSMSCYRLEGWKCFD